MKTWMITGWMAANISVLGAAPEAGPGEAYQALWNDPKVSRRIEEGIRANRMGDAVLRLTGAGSQPLSNAKVRVEQTRHDFLFGANIFMLGGFPTPEENRQFEKMFTSLLNYATVPFYWSDLEPEPGKPRFAKDSPPIYRRPPPDAVVEFCREHGLAMKGHPLVWHQWYPKWRPTTRRRPCAASSSASRKSRPATARRYPVGRWSTSLWDARQVARGQMVQFAGGLCVPFV